MDTNFMNSVSTNTSVIEEVEWRHFEIRNGVYQISDPESLHRQENLYKKVREREGRIHSDKLVRKLPLISRDAPYFEEWELRLITVMRWHKYLLDKNRPLKILDIGCGNGWMANLMTQVHESNVFGIDINTVELEQAARLFGNNPNLTLAYQDIQKDPFPENELDIVLLAATIQYFPDLSGLISYLLDYLSDQGEIHIIDSPLYSENQTDSAENRSIEYYTSLEFPEMANYYNHHTREELKDFNYQILYDPSTFINKMRRSILSSADSPFPWIRIKKEKCNI